MTSHDTSTLEADGVQTLQTGAGFELRCSQWVPAGIEDVFRFFSDPGNLERITPAFLHFRVRRVSSARIEEGTLLIYTLRLHGVPVLWRTRIEEWTPPHRFVDLQRFGPYALWHHTHTFEPEADGTRMRDVVRYRLHCTPLQSTPLLSWVHRDVRAIFEFRQRTIAGIFGERRPS